MPSVRLLNPQQPTFKFELPLFRRLYSQTLRMAVGPKVNGFDIRCRDGFSCYTALMTYNAIECLVEDFHHQSADLAGGVAEGPSLTRR